MPAVRTLSQLPELKSLTNETLVSMAQPQKMDINNEDEKVYFYQSRKVKISSLMQHTLSVVHDDLDRNNGLYEINIRELRDNVDSLSMYGTNESPVLVDGVKEYRAAPFIDESIEEMSAFNFNTSRKAVNVNTLSNYVFLHAAPNVTSAFGFVTCLSSNAEGDQPGRYLQLIDDTKEAKPYQFGLMPNSKQLVQNEFVFKIAPGETESNSWIAPASGMFTCYGWLDEKHNEVINNSNRWVALCAKNAWGNAKDKWFILQVQPFIKNKYLSYVGFSFPVSMGLELKIKIGFEAGSNSDKYFNVNGGLANRVPNAFFGGVYTGTINNKAIKVPFGKMTPVTGLPGNNDFDDYYVSQEELDALSDALCAENEEHRRKDTNMSSILDDLSSRIIALEAATGGGDDGSEFRTNIRKLSSDIVTLSSDMKTKVSLLRPETRVSGNQKQSILTLMKDPNDGYYTTYPGRKIYPIDKKSGDWSALYYKAGPTAGGTKQTATWVNTIDPATKTDKPRELSALDGLAEVIQFGGGTLNRADLFADGAGQIYKRYDAAGNISLAGKLYMDDNFFYYRILRDSTVRILLYPDCMANQCIVDCYMTHFQTENGVKHKKYTMLGRTIEKFNGTTDETESITVPLSAGSELAFAVWYLPKATQSGITVHGATTASSYDAASKRKKLSSPNNGNLGWTNCFNIRVAPDASTVSNPSLTIKVSAQFSETHDKGGSVYFRVVNSNGVVIGASQKAGSVVYPKVISGTCTWKPSQITAAKVTNVLTVQCHIGGVGASSTSDPQRVDVSMWLAKFSGTYKGETKNQAPVGISDYANMPWALPHFAYGDLSSIVDSEKKEMEGSARYAMIHPLNRDKWGASFHNPGIIAIIHEIFNNDKERQ